MIAHSDPTQPAHNNSKEEIVAVSLDGIEAAANFGCLSLPPCGLDQNLTEHEVFELHEQLTFITSSQKKRRITRQSTRESDIVPRTTLDKSSDRVLPSTEDQTDCEETFCFSAPRRSSARLTTPNYVRGDSLPASGIPPRLQAQQNSFGGLDYASSAGSSPCAASADVSVDNDRTDLDPGSSLQTPVDRRTRSRSPLVNAQHHAIMSDSADQTQRSSSPLKRRASSMEPEHDVTDGREDVDMLVLPTEPQEEECRTEQDCQAVRGHAVDGGTHEAPASSKQTTIALLREQIKTVETLVKAFAETPLQEGTEVYLVSRRWLGKAQLLGVNGKHGSKDSTLETLGPVDNSDIIQTIFKDAKGDSCVKLRPGMGSEHFELFPQEAWNLIISWYGLAPVQCPIVRTAHNTAPDSVSIPNIQVECHPPVFTIHRIWSAASPIPIEQSMKTTPPPPPVVMYSSKFPFMQFLRKAKELTGVEMHTKVRLWRVLQTLPAAENDPLSGMKTPPDSPSGPETETYAVRTDVPYPPGSWPEMLLDVVNFNKLERGVGREQIDEQDQTNNQNYNGRKSLAFVDLTVDQTLVLDEHVKGDSYVSTYNPRDDVKDKIQVSTGNSFTLTAVKGNASGRSSPAPSGPTTRGRAQKSGRTIGTTGLQNLGNTCYMNSALQCVRSVEELTKYFLTHEAQKEINADNPLSHNGDVALAYGRLLESIYKDAPPNSVAPREFKNTIGRYAPSFSGYGQQDSQEFLGFLLDGLQEDLSRIKKKPYIEKPDSTDDMIDKPEAIREMAMKVWDITKKRDDSVIADLFTGMYKSTLVCPKCDKISITFDPFNNLTLPLPLASMWTRAVKYFPLNDAPVDIMVDLDKNSSMKALKQYISARVGVPPERLFGGEEFREKFFKLYLDDYATVSEEIQSNDRPTMFELEAAPTNLVAREKKPKKKNSQPHYRSLLDSDDPLEEESPAWEDPLAERLLVPVVHRILPTNRRKTVRLGGDGPMTPPHFIVVTPEEARSEDVIRRKVLEKVATFTTWRGLAPENDSDSEETTDPELINTSSDADSFGDAKVTAKSVEGEEDIVDVSVTNVANDQKGAVSLHGSAKYPLLLKKFRNKRPKWLDPNEFLQAECQNLFVMGFFSESQVQIPSGWTGVNDDDFPPLSSRAPKPSASDVEMRSPSAWEGSDEGSDSTAAMPAVTRMNSESSDESIDFAPPKSLPNRFIAPRGNHVSARGKKKMKPGRTYGKKGKKRLEKDQRDRAMRQQQQQMVESSCAADTGADGGPLIRLGEGLVIDWSEDMWSEVFDGDSPTGRSGMKTYDKVAQLEDANLQAKQRQRELRKKNGISLDDCLDEFEKEEILSEQDTWYCPRCKEHRRASKKFDLWKTPDILIVHLKRFSSSGWRRDKLDVFVDFPVEGLDLTRRVIDKETGKQEVYDLIAVDDHWGGLGGGHYTAFARNFVDGNWYEYNDTSVSLQKDTTRVVTAAAYLLFYRRRSEPPLGGPKFQEIFDRYQQSDDEMQDSGEGQRLGQGSSIRGSPGASIGAGLVPRPGKGGRGLASTDDDGRPLNDATNGSSNGSDLWSAGQDTVRNSIEADDEGIGLPDYDNSGPSAPPPYQGGREWNFSKLDGDMQEERPRSLDKNESHELGQDDTAYSHSQNAWTHSYSGAKNGSDDAVEGDDDVASDVAQHDNSGDDARDFVEDNGFDNTHALGSNSEHDAGFIGPIDPTLTGVFPEPVPDLQGSAAMVMDQLTEHIWENKVHNVPVDMGVDEASDKVAEIHVDDADQEPLRKGRLF